MGTAEEASLAEAIRLRKVGILARVKKEPVGL
jgi:hypothetical protein